MTKPRSYTRAEHALYLRAAQQVVDTIISIAGGIPAVNEPDVFMSGVHTDEHGRMLHVELELNNSTKQTQAIVRWYPYRDGVEILSQPEAHFFRANLTDSNSGRILDNTRFRGSGPDAEFLAGDMGAICFSFHQGYSRVQFLDELNSNLQNVEWRE